MMRIDVIQQCSRYAALVSELAGRAIGLAVDARPHRPRAGETVWPAVALLPAARGAMGQGVDVSGLGEVFAEAAEADKPRFTDGLGHSRPVYHPLALHLYLAAGGAGDVSWARRDGGGDPALALWWTLCRWELGEPDTAAVDAAIGSLPQADGDGPAPLHALGLDDLLDAWTYRELVALHALHRLALLADRADWRGRVERAAVYHQGHTQPDYTTYQPWALAAFAMCGQTTMFADQQLHDTATHLSIEGGPGAALPALLLADAAALLRGQLEPGA